MQVFDSIESRVVEVDGELVEQRQSLSSEQIESASAPTLRFRMACLQAKASVPARSSSLQACGAKYRRYLHAECEVLRGALR